MDAALTELAERSLFQYVKQAWHVLEPATPFIDLTRQEACDWWDLTMSTRFNDPKTVVKVVVMQRLHELDLSGHLLRQGGWTHLCLPMEFEPSRRCTTVLGFADPRQEEHELMWPQRLGPKELDELKLSLNDYGVAGQLQQRPAPKGGGLFRQESFRMFDVTEITRQVEERDKLDLRKRDARPDDEAVTHEKQDMLFTLVKKDGEVKRWFASDCSWFQTIDTAIKIGAQNDYTVIMTLALSPENELLVYDIFRAKIEVPKQYDVTQQVKAACPQQLMFQAVEDKVSGSGLIQTGNEKGTPFRTLRAVGDKYQRAMPISTMYDNGRVYHRRGMKGLLAFHDELMSFPNGERWCK